MVIRCELLSDWVSKGNAGSRIVSQNSVIPAGLGGKPVAFLIDEQRNDTGFPPKAAGNTPKKAVTK